MSLQKGAMIAPLGADREHREVFAKASHVALITYLGILELAD